MVAALGPEICVHFPVPAVGIFPTILVEKTLQAKR